MTDFLRRYERDGSAPSFAQWRSDLGRRALLPALGLWALIVAVGLVIMHPLEGFPQELAVNLAFEDARTETMNQITSFWSNIGATFFIIAACAVATALIWWRTKEWWFAVVPAIAISVQSAVFVSSAFVVGRSRPDVEHLDESPPTSGFPSGHTGASTAFYLAMAMMAYRISNPVLRYAAMALCLLVPLLVAYARLYRGMHHLSDVIVGLLNGIACAFLAWRYLRRQDRTPSATPA